MSDIAKTFDKGLARWWQRVLGIQDWRLNVLWLPNAKFTERYGSGRAGICDAVQTRQWAAVAVNLSPDDGSDPEHSLVHEECHVLTNDIYMTVMRLLDDYITDERAREYAKDDFNAKLEVLVDKIATGYMRLKRMAERKGAVRGAGKPE